MNREEKLRMVLPPVIIAVLVFLGVMAGFVAGGVRRTQHDLGVVTEFANNRSNAVLVQAGDGGAAELICIVSANPRSGALTVMAVPPEIPVDIAGSRQTLGAAMSIGGTDMLMEKLAEVIPLPLHHYMVFSRPIFAQTMSALGVSTAAFDGAGTPKRRYEAGGALCLDAARALTGAGTQVAELETFFGKVHTDFSVYGVERYDHFLKRISFAGTERMVFPGSYNVNENTFTPDRAALDAAINRLLAER